MNRRVSVIASVANQIVIRYRLGDEQSAYCKLMELNFNGEITDHEFDYACSTVKQFYERFVKQPSPDDQIHLDIARKLKERSLL